ILGGILHIWFALNMSLTNAKITWAVFPLTLIYWTAMLKGVRMLGGKEGQGKLFGIFASMWTLIGLGISSIALYVFSRYADEVAGFKAVVFVYSAFNFLAAILVWFFYEDPKPETNSESPKESPKVGLKEIMVVLKNPLIWLISILIAVITTLYNS